MQNANENYLPVDSMDWVPVLSIAFRTCLQSTGSVGNQIYHMDIL